MAGDNNNYNFGALEQNMRNIDRNTECLPALCKDVAEHGVEIKQHGNMMKNLDEKLDKHVGSLYARFWSLLVTLLVGAITVIAALLYHR